MSPKQLRKSQRAYRREADDVQKYKQGVALVKPA